MCSFCRAARWNSTVGDSAEIARKVKLAKEKAMAEALKASAEQEKEAAKQEAAANGTMFTRLQCHLIKGLGLVGKESTVCSFAWSGLASFQ